MWWSPASGGKIARVYFGSYELEQTSLMALSIGAGDIFVDIGANHGFYTLLASRQVGLKGKVLSFEPDPVNFHLLEQHTKIVNLDSDTDYRLRALKQAEIYHHPLDPEADLSLRRCFDAIAPDVGQDNPARRIPCHR